MTQLPAELPAAPPHDNEIVRPCLDDWTLLFTANEVYLEHLSECLLAASLFLHTPVLHGVKLICLPADGSRNPSFCP